MSVRQAKFLRCLAALALAALGVLVVVGCGGSGPAEATGKEGDATSSGVIVKSNDAVTKTEGAVVSGKYPSGHDTDEESTSGYEPVKPCSLVSETQANRILGGNVQVSEHLQGPTCVFSGSGREVSLVVMEAPIESLVKGARRAQPLKIAGQEAWCVTYETTSVVASVNDGRLLQVTGACPAAADFAAAALAWFS